MEQNCLANEMTLERQGLSFGQGLSNGQCAFNSDASTVESDLPLVRASRGKKFLRKVGLLLAAFFIFAVALLIGVTISPKYSETANAEIEPMGRRWDGDVLKAYVHCTNCNFRYTHTLDGPDDHWDDWQDYFWDWELNTPYCEECYHGNLCENCHSGIGEAWGWCNTCCLCSDCFDSFEHCHQCAQCNQLCSDCEDAGIYICENCHSPDSDCPGCGKCLYALMQGGPICEDFGARHCVECDEEWICEECGDCFFNNQALFCSECSCCIACCKEIGFHCKSCEGCYADVDACLDSEDYCIPCCKAEGFHCVYCEEHVLEWCNGGPTCYHCHDCAEDIGALCDNCGKCILCDGIVFCEECGYCTECCRGEAESLGCECLEYCAYGSDFMDETHLCSNCQSNFSCAGEEFCDVCGFCMDCCLANAEDRGCVCGMCVEDGDFEDHMCPNCGFPTCVNGELCEYCGYCEECCITESENASCSCGICVADPAFDDEAHKCTGCEQLSCNIDFCEDCGLCLDCCTANAEDEGCKHGVCVLSDEWLNHFCTTCNKCKEDCDCGEDCCDDPSTVISDLHGTPVPEGYILKHPSPRVRTVTSNDIVDRADNTVKFKVRVYDPHNNVSYQWYVKVDDEEPVALEYQGHYYAYYEEDLIFVDGVNTEELLVSVPVDACAREYYYYCVVTNSDGETFTSNQARLTGRHNYEWLPDERNTSTYSKTHSYHCKGCLQRRPGSQKAHTPGPWQYQYYATSKYGARLIRQCNVCGTTCDAYVTEPLGDHPYHEYAWMPKYIYEDYVNTGVSKEHQLVCVCGKVADTSEHLWSSWRITQVATEKHTGTKDHYCVVCNYYEEVVIKKQMHEHTFSLDPKEDGSYSQGDSDSQYHWIYCDYAECYQIAFKEEHTYGNWYMSALSAYDFENGVDRKVIRACTKCGYQDWYYIKGDYKAVAFTNATVRVQSLDSYESGRMTYTATARVPEGYYFDHWEVVSGEFNFDTFYWKKIKDEKGNVISTQRVYTNIYSEKIAFELVHDYNWHETLYELKAVCYRYENQLEVYPDPDKDDRILLVEGMDSYIGTNVDPDDHTVGWSDAVLKVSRITTDKDGVRDMYVHMHGYNGGPIAVVADEQPLKKGLAAGLPCNLHITLDANSTITSYGTYGIFGCAVGGNITISSNNNAKLTIIVKGWSEDVYGIITGRKSSWYEDKIILAGNVRVEIKVLSPYSKVTGIYTKSWLQVLEQASLTINASSTFHGERSKSVVAVGVDVGKEFLINTEGKVEIITDGCISIDGVKKTRNVKAKAITIENVDYFKLVYPEYVRNGYNAVPEFDALRFISYPFKNSLENGRMIEKGVLVEFELDENAILNVEKWYQNEDGYYLVRKNESVYFTVSPALGYYDIQVVSDGYAVNPYYSKDGVTQKYAVYNVTEPITIKVRAGSIFFPFVSDPDVTQTEVFSGSDAILSYRMSESVVNALYVHAMLNGEVTLTPVFKPKDKTDITGEPVPNNLSVYRVFLQREDEDGAFVNTSISFMPSAIGNERFNDSKDNLGKTVTYRLMVIFDGKEYPSETFQVTWTDDPSDYSEPMVNTVELHVKHSCAVNGVARDGDGWLRLNSSAPYYLYDVVSGKGYAGNYFDYRRSFGTKSSKNLIIVAEFDYHKGTLILYGDEYWEDFDKDGEKEHYDVSGEILAIRASSTSILAGADLHSYGGLIIELRGDVHMGGNYDSCGYDVWKDSEGNIVDVKHDYAQESVILNDTEGGFVRIVNNTDETYVLYLSRTGRESIVKEMRTREYMGVSATGNIEISGKINMSVSLNIDPEMTEYSQLGLANRFGLYTEGDVILRGDALFYCYSPITNPSLCLQGVSEGVRAVGSVYLYDNSSMSLECAAYKQSVGDHAPYFLFTAENLYVLGNSSFKVYSSKEIYTPVRVYNDVLIATSGDVAIRSLSEDEGAEVHGANLFKSFVVSNPSNFSFESMIEGSFVWGDGEVVFDGTFVNYKVDDGKLYTYGDYYYSGVNYEVMIIPNDVFGTWIEDESTHTSSYCCGEYNVTVTSPTKEAMLKEKYYGRSYFNVRMGDKVSIVAKDAPHGFTFDGWNIVSGETLTDLIVDGLSVTFTMAGSDVMVYPVYTSIAFTEEPPCFVMADRDADIGSLYWRIDASSVLSDAQLQYLDNNGVWNVVQYYKDGDEYPTDLDLARLDHETMARLSGLYTYRGEVLLRRSTVEWDDAFPIDVQYTTYRLSVSCYDTDESVWCEFYSEPFEIDFDKGIHVLAADDNEAPDVEIPSGYVGTEYVLYLRDYIFSDYGFTYDVSLNTLMGPVSEDICKVTIYNDTVIFSRNGACGTIYAIEGGAYVTATDNNTGRSFRIPFNFGEIVDSEAYALAVNGKKVFAHNKDDILGDGKVSYNPDAKKLTLKNAKLTDLYVEDTGAKSTKYAYAIMSVQELTIELIGNNVIEIDPYSKRGALASFEAFDGLVVGIGNAVGSDWADFEATDADKRITFIGDGSLTVIVKGSQTAAVRSVGTVIVNGAKVTVQAEENGIFVTNGDMQLLSGSLSIDAKNKSAVKMLGGSASFYMEDGELNLNGGVDDYAISMYENNSTSIYFAKGKVDLKTKSDTYSIANRNIDFNENNFKAYYSDNGSLVEGDPSSTTNFVKMHPDIFVWVNGERITQDNLTVVCGDGTATYDPDSNVLTLKNATIEKGIAYYRGMPFAAGIYSEQPIYINIVGTCKIDLTSKELYDAYTGEAYEPLAEDEDLRTIIGINLGYSVTTNNHGYETFDLTLVGGTLKVVCGNNGIYEGLDVDGSVTLEGTKVIVSNSSVGISTFTGLTLNSGSVRLESNKESAYAVFGSIFLTDDYKIAYSIFGCDSGDLVRLSLADLNAEYGDSFGQNIHSLWLRDFDVTGDVIHYYGEPTYNWSKDGKTVSAMRVCDNDDFFEEETVDVFSEVTKQPTCSAKGETTYTSADFSNEAFSKQTRTLADIDALPHDPTDWIIISEPTCKDFGTKHILCKVCGEEIEFEYIMPLEHVAGDWEVSIPATCTEKGLNKKVCTLCGETLDTQEVEPTHTASDWIVVTDADCTEKGLEKKVCTVCEEALEIREIAALGHNYGDWTIVKAATETEEGEEERICSRCDNKETRTIPVIGHVHSFVFMEANEVTCTEDGNIAYYVCSSCKRLYTDEAGENEINEADVVIKAVGHVQSEWDIIKAPTCTEEGRKHIICTVCGEELQVESVAATGHTASEWTVVKAADCLEKGVERKICTVCEEELGTREIAALGHDYGAWTVVKAATDTEEGEEERICSRCDKKETRSIPVIGHVHAIVAVEVKEATCTNNGNVAYYTCSSCGRIFADEKGNNELNVEDVTIVAIGHKAGEWIVTLEPTCAEKGSKHILCTVCEEELQVEEIDALGHTFGDWVVTKEAKVGVKGEETRTCTVCETTETREIAALPYVPAETLDGKKIYNETVTEEAKDLTNLFKQAKEEEGTVEIKAGALLIAFDTDAVDALGGADVSISAKVVTENVTVENAELVLEVTLQGATFENGKATVVVPFNKAVPEGKVAKVYYIDDNGNRTDMNATFADGKATFTTNHFSTYAVFFEDIVSTPAKSGLSGGAIAGIVIGSVVFAAAVCVLVIFLLKKKKNK